MAEKKITCCRCGEQFVYTVVPGRPPQYCPDCALRRLTAPRAHYTRDCAGCGRTFQSLVYWAKCCSRVCGKRARKRHDPARSALEYQAKERARKAKRASDPDHGKQRAIRALINALKRHCQQLGARGKALKPCATCGSPIGSGTKAYKYCSRECRDRGDATKAARRKGRSAHRAAKRSTTVVAFDPIFVLERDHWTCQICGIRTPRRLRGTHAPNAPEVDHIVPLSKNGKHILSNVQCACRKCNRSKGATSLGQLNLGWAA
jgi:5-methylcytosine-specific restriction endonuclease McrA